MRVPSRRVVQQPGPGQGPKVVGGVGDALVDLAGDLLDRALALGEHDRRSRPGGRWPAPWPPRRSPRTARPWRPGHPSRHPDRSDHVLSILKRLLDELVETLARRCRDVSMELRDRERRRRGPRPLVVRRRPRRRHRARRRPGPVPGPATPHRRRTGLDDRLDGRHPLPRRLHLRQPRARGRRRDVPRVRGRRPRGRRTGPSTPARRSTLAPAIDAAGHRHARPHARPPRLPAARRRRAGGAVLRRVADGRRRSAAPTCSATSTARSSPAPCSGRSARRSSPCPTTSPCTRPTAPGRSARHRRARRGRRPSAPSGPRTRCCASTTRTAFVATLLDGLGQLPHLLPPAARDQPARSPPLPASSPRSPGSISTRSAATLDDGAVARRRPTHRRVRRGARARARCRSSTGACSPAGSAGSSPSIVPSCSSSTRTRTGPTWSASASPSATTACSASSTAGSTPGRRPACPSSRSPLVTADHIDRNGPRRPPGRRVGRRPRPRRHPRRARRPRHRRRPRRAADGDVRTRRTRHERRQHPRRPPATDDVAVLAGGPEDWHAVTGDRSRDRVTTLTDAPAAPVRLGLRENLAQFSLLVAVNALVGGMIGQERTVLPLLAEREFGLTAFTAGLTFIAAFGAVKAVTNFFAGTLSDRYGRKPVLVAGWIIGVPVPLLLIWAPTLGVGHRRQRPARHQPGPHLVHHRHHEDRPRRPGPPRVRHGVQRSRRLRGRRPHRAGHRLHRRQRRPATRALLPRHRLRGARPRPVDPVRPRDPRPRRPRSPRPRPRRSDAQHRARCSVGPASRTRRCRRAARPGW